VGPQENALDGVDIKLRTSAIASESRAEFDFKNKSLVEPSSTVSANSESNPCSVVHGLAQQFWLVAIIVAPTLITAIAIVGSKRGF
jgi:hypothetical protein